MITFCNICNHPLASNAQYCSKCGSPVGDVPADPTIVRQGGASQGAAPVIDIAVSEAEPVPAGKRNWLLIGGAAATLLLVGLLYFFLFVFDDMGHSSERATTVVQNEDGTVAEQNLFVIAEANVRDKATVKGSAIIGKLQRGNAVSGRFVPGEDDAESQWLELADGKGFINGVNLMELQPPELVQNLSGKIWTADGPVDIWKQPDSSSDLVDRVSEGTKLTLSGLTANDYLEVKLKAGGVGYVVDAASILARLGGKPVDLTFAPDQCDFGTDLNALLTQIGNKARAEWDAADQRDYPNAAARDAAMAKIGGEGDSRYQRVQRSWNGLSITAVAQHYESQSIYFADPPARVIEIFREKGYKLDRKGNFPTADVYAGIAATRGESAAYGKTELGCGV